MLRVCGKVLMIQTLRWADEIRDVDFKGVNSKAKISDRELDMSEKLVESYSEDFTPEEFSDDYQVELRKLIDAKIESGESFDVERTFDEDDSEDTGGGDVIDLMEALRTSVDRSRSSKKERTKKKADSKQNTKRSTSEEIGDEEIEPEETHRLRRRREWLSSDLNTSRPRCS